MPAAANGSRVSKPYRLPCNCVRGCLQTAHSPACNARILQNHIRHMKENNGTRAIIPNWRIHYNISGIAPYRSIQEEKYSSYAVNDLQLHTRWQVSSLEHRPKMFQHTYHLNYVNNC